MKNHTKTIEIIKLCFIPFSIISPIPIFCVTLYLLSFNISDNNLFLLSLGIIISLISSGASNFWNHTNDIKEDSKNNKNTLFTKGLITNKEAIIISIVLYLISILLILYESLLLDRPIYIFFAIWVIITWWYSDNVFLKKILGIRLKAHYFGEILTYVLAYPAYTMSIWLIFSDSFTRGYILSLIFLCFGLSGVLIKDLKDIKGDREAGLKTLGVTFAPSKLLKFSNVFIIVLFCIIIISTNLGIFSGITFIVILPFMYFLKNTIIYFHRKNWKLEIGDYNNVKTMVVSTYLSICLLGLSNYLYR
jgi:1,4-dihydroxy-2-naphthoate octaprenyltransferase